MAFNMNQQYIVDEKGNPTAVIISIDDYKRLLSLFKEAKDIKGNKILAKSEEYKKLLKRAI